MKRIWVPQLIACLMLLWALNTGNPYGYYTLLRVVCCGIFAYLGVQAVAQAKERLAWVLGAIAVIYNPIFTIHLNREMWSFLNLVTIIAAILSIFSLKALNQAKEK